MQFHLSDFENYLLHEKRYSTHTVTAYLSDFNQFLSYLSEFNITSAPTVEGKRIRAWIAQLMDDGISPRSIRRKISVLNTYFRFLKINNIVSVNPVQKAPLPKVSKKLPVYVEETSMENLFTFLAEDNPTWQTKRDLLIIEIFYTTGIRLAELISLQENSIDFSRSLLKVTGKRNKDRLIPFTNLLGESLDQYLVLKKEHWKTNKSDHLFVTNKGNKLYSKFVYRLVNSYLNAVSTIKKKSPHVLRHTFATHMLNNGADINAIKELLGHANLSATQIYTHNSIEKLKHIHKQSHPKG